MSWFAPASFVLLAVLATTALDRRRLAVGVFVIPLAAIFIAKCAGDPVRPTLYPSSFEYVNKGELSTKMAHLAADVRALDTLLRETPPDGVPGPGVVELLRSLETTAASLDHGAELTNHPELDRNLDAFVREVRAAREAAEAEPASYFLAGSIAGACQYCHR